MRIRKHAKISPLLYTSSSLKPGTVIQPHVCQLNQSPWDAMTFSPPSSSPPPPPPPCQLNRSGISAGNGSSERCISFGEREITSRRRSDATTHNEAAPPVESEQTIICCKTDGKSWQCRREAAKGNSLCDHHSSLVKSYGSSSFGNIHAGKKLVKAPLQAAAADLPRRGRVKKAPASTSSNPYEFYYYSGFGPRWGKQRGEDDRKNSSMPKNVGGDDDNASGEAEAEAVAISNLDEFEYEDEDEDEYDSRDNGRKRVRKPIKARSLKSLL